MKLKKGMRVLLKSKDKIKNDLIPAPVPKSGFYYYYNVVYTPSMINCLGKVVTIEQVLEPGDEEFSIWSPAIDYGVQLFKVDGFVYNDSIIERIIEDEEYDFSTPLGTIHCTLQLAKTIACGYMTMAMHGADHYRCLADPLLDQIESIETKEE